MILLGKLLLSGATSFLFTKYKYLGIFMVFCGVGIVLFLGSVEGFNKDSEEKFCKLVLSNAVFGTVSFLIGALLFILVFLE